MLRSITPRAFCGESAATGSSHLTGTIDTPDERGSIRFVGHPAIAVDVGYQDDFPPEEFNELPLHFDLTVTLAIPVRARYICIGF
jgi:hypothetical protein